MADTNQPVYQPSLYQGSKSMDSTQHMIVMAVLLVLVVVVLFLVYKYYGKSLSSSSGYAEGLYHGGGRQETDQSNVGGGPEGSHTFLTGYSDLNRINAKNTEQVNIEAPYHRPTNAPTMMAGVYPEIEGAQYLQMDLQNTVGAGTVDYDPYYEAGVTMEINQFEGETKPIGNLGREAASNLQRANEAKMAVAAVQQIVKQTGASPQVMAALDKASASTVASATAAQSVHQVARAVGAK